MAQVTFLPKNVTVEVEPGTRMLDAALQHGVEIITGCTMGICATDTCAVVQGIENIAPPNEDEADTLTRVPPGRNIRLACQAVILGDCVIEVNV